MYTRVLTYLAVLLVVFFKASSAPVDLELESELKSPDLSESYRTLPIFSETVEKIRAENSPRAVSKTGGTFSNFSCAACRYAVRFLQDMFDRKLSFDAIADAVGEICYLAKIQDKTVCHGITETFKDEVLTVFSMVALSPSEVCAGYLKQCGSEYNPFDQLWNISVPGNKPSVQPVPSPKDGAPVTRILQLTDIHYDPLYTEGLSNKCGEPLCCRQPNSPGSGKTAAGPWGDYNCDVPNKTIVHLFKTLQKMQDQFDLIYWTGDVVAHAVWNQTRTGTLEDMKYFYDLFEKYLPDKMLFPTFGNHDTVPVNSFSQPFITGEQSMEWIVEPTLGNWSRWLSQYPDWETTQASIKKGGYYNVKVRDGLRVIGLQTTYCEKTNFWLLINATDPAGQLQWLADQLLEAEQAGERVHILGHHPPGIYDSVLSYGDNYRRIVNRFESTIVGQFFGHTHTDTFKIYTDDDFTPTSVQYISPGVTSYPGLNLGFRIYTVDGNYNGSTHAVLDHDNYIFDLNKANHNNSPEWVWEYSAKKSYNLSSMQPDSFFQFWKTMHTDNQALRLFNLHSTKNRSDVNLNNRYPLCDIVTTTLKNSPLCSKYESAESVMMHYADSFERYRLTRLGSFFDD